MRLAAIASVTLVACATVPDFHQERLRVLGETDTLCWVSTRDFLKEKSPDGFQLVLNELGARKAVCSPEAIERGRQRVVAQSDRERAITQQVEARNAQTAGTVLRTAAGIAGLILLAPALAPQPPPPVTCTWYTAPNNRTGMATCR